VSDQQVIVPERRGGEQHISTKDFAWKQAMDQLRSGEDLDANQVALLFGVTRAAVGRWATDKKLKGRRIPVGRAGKSPGGSSEYWSFAAEDVIAALGYEV
jgi:hypothetical protein